MYKAFGAVILLTALLGASRVAVADATICDGAAPIEVDGQRRLALIVGVGKFKAPKLNSLPGAPKDARRFFDLLTGPSGYGFPAQNVCMLLDEQATVAAFRAKFDQLVKQARQNDEVVVYFAGHGSQQRDLKGDERDDYDETLVFHDSRTGNVTDLVDDDFRDMLVRLHGKTQNIVVVLDSCNSASATRGDETGTLTRYAEPDPEGGQRGGDAAKKVAGDGRPSLTRENLPGMVIMAAAADGTSALERDGAGIFTKALTEALGGPGPNKLTYAQAEKEVRALMSGRTPQIPTFEGNLDQTVFGNARRGRPLSLQVESLSADAANKPGSSMKLIGTPPPGLGKNAVLRIFDAKLPRIRNADPTQAKATIVIDKTDGLKSDAHVVQAGPVRQPIQIGDLAVLIQAGDEYVKLPVRIRSAGSPGGVAEARAAAIRKAIADAPQIKTIVRIVDDSRIAADYEVSLGSGDELELRDVANRVLVKYRNGEGEATRVAANLWSRALQRAMLQLHGEGGQELADNDTLKVSLEQMPADTPSPCQSGPFEKAAPNTKQVVPLCAIYHVKLELAASAPRPMLVGVLLLSSDGKIITISDSKEVLPPGKSTILPKRIRATIPLNVEDYVLAVATDQSQPIPWQYFSSTDVLTESGVRGEGSPLVSEMQSANPLSAALYRYVMPGTRGGEDVTTKAEDNKPWTRSVVPVEVRANNRFFTPRSDSEPVTTREFTLRKFDVRPYLPDNKNSALYQVLSQADKLTRFAGTDGVGYKQHDWKEPTDEANLKKGIDCSRALWYVFKKANLPYNKSQAFLTTAAMIGPSSRMNENFESCNSKPYQIGDILVYRDVSNTTGHTVMVIDPDQTQRIAWGSHGYDSSAPKNSGIKPDIGVEYQKIMSRADWQRWDKMDMQLKQCWRYRKFSEELKQPGGAPGLQALTKPCEPDYCVVK